MMDDNLNKEWSAEDDQETAELSPREESAAEFDMLQEQPTGDMMQDTASEPEQDAEPADEQAPLPLLQQDEQPQPLSVEPDTELPAEESPEMAAPAHSAINPPPALTDALPQPEKEQPPAMPTEQDDYEEKKKQYWKSVLTGDPATVPTEIRRMSGVDDDDMPEEQKEYKLLTTVNKSWAADHLPRTREQIASSWPQQRAELAQRFGVQNNEHELFLALSQEEEDAPRRAAAEEIYKVCYLAGLDDKEPADISKLVETLSDEDARHARTLAQTAYSQGQQNRQKLSTLATRIVRGMDTFAAVEEDAIAAPRVIEAAPELIQAIDELAELDDSQRNTALYLAAGMATKQSEGQEEAGLLTRMKQAVRRGISRLGAGSIQAISNVGIATLNRLGKQIDSDRMQELAGSWDKRMQMFEKLQKLSQDELRPLVLPEEANGVASYLITAAEAAPAALLSCCGGAGFAALTLGTVGQTVAEARNRAPMASQELQLYAGLLGGALQAGIYMNMNRIGGKLLEQSISRIGRASGMGIAGYTLAGLNVMGSTAVEASKMLLAGKLAAAADLGTQEIAARLSQTASNIDWKAFGDNLTDIEANMHEAAAMLPYLLIGSGRLALQHFRSPRAILGEGRRLDDWGVTEEQKKAILAEGNLALQSEMLHEAISNSKMWAGLEFLPAAWRALRLLHSDSFQKFQSVEHVRDFLKLPPPQFEKSAEPPLPKKIPYDPAQAGKNHRLAEAMTLWNEWWRQARLDLSPAAYPSPDIYNNVRRTPADHSIMAYSSLYLMNTQVPRRMNELGIYAPKAESERMIMLRDRIEDLNRLSYQFIMNIYSVDTLAGDMQSLSGWRSKTERTRKCLLGAVARAVVGTARGATREEAIKSLYNYIIGFYTRRKYQGIRTGWLKNVDASTIQRMPDYADTYYITKREDQPEMMNALRLISGLKSGVDALIDVLPLTTDFQTALTRGLSPEQAYINILNRELALPEDQLRSKDIKLGKEIKNVTHMPRYTWENSQQFETYRQLTGTDIERVLGDDAAIYNRARRPDGSYTHWHAEAGQVMNDIAGNAALRFMPFGHNNNMLNIHTRNGQDVDMLNRYAAKDDVFTAYDQLCNIAKRDLSDQWHGNITLALPHFYSMPTRRFFRNANWDDGMSPRIKELNKNSNRYKVDTYSEVTPLAMAQSRFYVYWQRMINSSFITAEQLGDFLVSQEFITEAEKRSILVPPPPHVNIWKESRDERIAQKQAAQEERLAGIPRNMAEKMAEYTTMRFLTDLPNLAIPATVKEWVGMAAFCPDFSEDKKKSYYVPMKKDGTGLISWANRTVAKKLRSIAPQVDKLRNLLADGSKKDPFMEPLISDAMGLDLARRCEKAWSLVYYGKKNTFATELSYWNLLRSPRWTWERMTEEERAPWRSIMMPFCSHEAAFAPEKPGQDHVDVAIEMLDELLHTYPEIHQYSIRKNDEGMMQQVQFYKENVVVDEMEPPLYEPMPLYQGNHILYDDYEIHSAPELPEYFESDSRIPLGLTLLELMRSRRYEQPHAYDDGIWWNSKLYGLGGESPLGRYKTLYFVERPLEPLLNILQEIGRYEEENGPFSICGVRVRGLDRQLNLRPLQTITIYRSKTGRHNMVRLMPGELESVHKPMTRPYLVSSHNGVYLNGDKIVTDPNDLDNIYIPLQTFNPESNKYFRRAQNEWINNTYRHNLEQALSLCETANSTPDEISHSANMLEYLMRIAEDSGFSPSLVNVSPHTLTQSQARLLNLMRELIANMCSLDPEDTSQNISHMIKSLDKHPEELDNMVRTLINSKPVGQRAEFTTSQKLENILHSELKKAEQEAFRNKKPKDQKP